METILFIILGFVNIIFVVGFANSQLKFHREIEERYHKKTEDLIHEIRNHKVKFSSIKEVRPTEGSHIFIWDAVQKIALPVNYSGKKETWEEKKGQETRFTHFIELGAPE